MRSTFIDAFMLILGACLIATPLPMWFGVLVMVVAVVNFARKLRS